MGSHAIVMLTPALDHDLRLLQRREDLTIEKLVAQSPVEALHVAVLPWAAALDVGRPRANRANPALHGLSNELRTLVQANVRRHTPKHKQISQCLDHSHRVQPARHFDRKALASELIDNVEHAILPPI